MAKIGKTTTCKVPLKPFQSTIISSKYFRMGRKSSTYLVGKQSDNEFSRLESLQYIIHNHVVILGLIVGFITDIRALRLGSDMDGGVGLLK